MPKRIFVALPISEKLQKEILDWESRYPMLKVRWLNVKNLHITLVPPWYEDNVESIVGKLKNVGGVGPVDAIFSRVCYGPDPKKARLIWAEGAVPERLQMLKDRIEQALGRKDERHPWRLHLTLARFREEDFANLAVKNLDERVEWKERFDSFVLMASRLERAGAEYEVLERFPF